MGIKKSTESDLVRQFLDYLKLVPGVECWRNNNTGVKRTVKGKTFWTFSGRRGVSDILGILSVDSLFKGTFIAIEVKKPKENPTPEQQVFLDMIRSRGGIAIVAHDLEELRIALREEGIID